MHTASVSSADRKDTVRVTFVTHEVNALKALRERCLNSPGFKRLLALAGYSLISRGKKVVLGGNSPEAVRALQKAIDAFSQQHRASVAEGAAASWSYLLPKKKKVGKKKLRVLTKVTKLEALCALRRDETLEGFKVRKLLGYTSSISWQAAAKLNRVHAPPYFYFVPENERLEDTAHDLDLNANEHFRNDTGTYDDAGILTSFSRQDPETWETAYRTQVEAWNSNHSYGYRVPTPTRFYPASPATPIRGSKGQSSRWHIDHHGVSELLRYRDHCERCQKALKRLKQREDALPKAPLYHARLKSAANELLETERIITLGRRAELDADDAEVLEHAERDVPETILELFEQQVKELKGKAPKGLIAALAKARLEASENDKQNVIFHRSLLGLEQTAQRYAVV